VARDGLDKLRTDILKLKRELIAAQNRANEKTARGAILVLKHFSSGRVSTWMMSQGPPGLNHPYGIGPSNKRGPRGPIPYNTPTIINRQTGIFAASWRMRHYYAFGSRGIKIENIASYAEYLEHGTRLMIPRPVDLWAREYIARAGPINFYNEALPVFARALNG